MSNSYNAVSPNTFNMDEAVGFSGMNAFDDKAVRRGFVRKVYLLLSAQLSITFGGVLTTTLIRDNDPKGYQTWAVNNYWLLIVGMVGMIGLAITLSCFEKPRRTHPTNLILLTIFSLATTIVTCYGTMSIDTPSIALAAGLTLLITIALTVFAIQTKIDFTVCYQFVFVSFLLLFMFGFSFYFFRNKVAELIYGVLGALLFSFYIIFDTQLIMGNHKYSISPEEYVMATLTIYLDIVNLFLYLLQIIAGARR